MTKKCIVSFIYANTNISSNPSFYFCCYSSGGGSLFGSTGMLLSRFHKSCIAHTQTSLTFDIHTLIQHHIPLFSTCHHWFVWFKSCPSNRRIVRIYHFCPIYFWRTVWFHSGTSDWWFVWCTGSRYLRDNYYAILYFISYFLPQYYLFARHL